MRNGDDKKEKGVYLFYEKRSGRRRMKGEYFEKTLREKALREVI